VDKVRKSFIGLRVDGILIIGCGVVLETWHSPEHVSVAMSQWWLRKSVNLYPPLKIVKFNLGGYRYEVSK